MIDLKKIVLIVLAVFLFKQGFAQQQSFFSCDSIPRRSISFSSNFDFGSSFANNQFINQFFVGGTIDRPLKDDMYEKLSAKNTVGGDFNLILNAELTIDTLFGKTNFSLIVGVEHNEHFDGKFTSDLIQLIFDGNKQFAGKYANLSGSNYNYLNYQKINFGFINYKKGSQISCKEGAVFSFIKAQEFQAMVIPEGTLFTEQYGDRLVFDMDYMYNNSDTSKTGLSAFNGFGIATDLFSEYKLKTGGKIKIYIDDLGFIQWNKNSVQIEADSTLTFDGVEVDNILDLNDNVVSSFSQDSLLDYVSNKKSKTGFTVALPTSFDINYQQFISKKINIIGGIRYKILSNYFPLLYANVQYYATPSFILQGNLLYGGYGRFNFGVAFAKRFTNKYEIILGTNHLGAYLVPSHTFNNSGFLGLKAYF